MNLQIDSPPTALHEVVTEEAAEEGNENEGEDYRVDVVHRVDVNEGLFGR